MNLDLETRLLDEFQRDFPICPTPFTKLAHQLGISEQKLLGALEALSESGKISRVGPVFAPRRVGVSTLAAMAVPPHALETVAQAINRFPEVNHNYEREHAYNLWFVVTAASDCHLQETLSAIEHAAGYPAINLPMEEAFYIDLGFGLKTQASQMSKPRLSCLQDPPLSAPETMTPLDRRLLAALQQGLPLQTRPFAFIAQQIGDSESNVVNRIQDWIERGIIKRFGIIVRHHELGFTANAMLVHDIPDETVQAIGRNLAGDPAVTLCYRRRRHPSAWHFNLFCMIHGQERSVVLQQIETLRAQHGLQNFPHAVLFSRARFKQQGARYA